MTPIASSAFACSVRAPLPRRRGKEPLTAAERGALAAITWWVDAYGQAPLRRELGESLGVSDGHASWLVITLRSKGWVTLQPHVPRSVQVV